LLGERPIQKQYLSDMERVKYHILLSFAAAALCSCTIIHVRKVVPGEPEPPGLQYCLPKPYILATPKADGSISFETIFIRDNQNRYAIDARSYLAKHTLKVTLQDGILTKVETVQDNTSVLAKLADSSGALAKSVIDREVTKAATEKTAQAAHESTIRDKVLAVRQAEIDRDNLPADAASKDKAAAVAAVAKANAALDAAMLSPNDKIAVTLKSAKGPILYAINEDKDGVSLKAVPYESKDAPDPVQLTLPSSLVVPSGEAKVPVDFTLEIKDGKDILKAGSIEITLISSVELTGIDTDNSNLKDSSDAVVKKGKDMSISQPNPKSVLLKVGVIPPGEYKLTVPATPHEGQLTEKIIKFSVVP